MCESIFTWFADRGLYFGRLCLRLFKSKLLLKTKLQLYFLCSSVKLKLYGYTCL
jgi:hypothetical protein